jgi:hypothetical protein
MRLNFLHPVVQEGVNSTVRLGIRDYSIDESVFIYETGKDDPIARGFIDKLVITRFEYLTDEDIMYQHDEETRDFDGLFAAMKRAYGDDFNELSVVTVVHFFVEEIF